MGSAPSKPDYVIAIKMSKSVLTHSSVTYGKNLAPYGPDLPCDGQLAIMVIRNEDSNEGFTGLLSMDPDDSDSDDMDVDC